MPNRMFDFAEGIKMNGVHNREHPDDEDGLEDFLAELDRLHPVNGNAPVFPEWLPIEAAVPFPPLQMAPEGEIAPDNFFLDFVPAFDDEEEDEAVEVVQNGIDALLEEFAEDENNNYIMHNNNIIIAPDNFFLDFVPAFDDEEEAVEVVENRIDVLLAEFAQDENNNNIMHNNNNIVQNGLGGEESSDSEADYIMRNVPRNGYHLVPENEDVGIPLEVAEQNPPLQERRGEMPPNNLEFDILQDVGDEDMPIEELPEVPLEQEDYLVHLEQIPLEDFDLNLLLDFNRQEIAIEQLQDVAQEEQGHIGDIGEEAIQNPPLEPRELPLVNVLMDGCADPEPVDNMDMDVLEEPEAEEQPNPEVQGPAPEEEEVAVREVFEIIVGGGGAAGDAVVTHRAEGSNSSVMASVSYQIANLLEKMQSSDKDFRFMATNDLMVELQKDSIKLDDDSERKVVRMLLRLLEDKNGEVQNLAVRCLGPLVNKVKEYQVETIVEALCANMVSDKEQLRDISSIGLKTVIAQLPQASGGLSGNIAKKITSKLATAIERQEDVSVQLEALDIVTDLLSRFGNVVSGYHSQILNALLPQLCSQRQAVRKRTIAACSHLVVTCTPLLYIKLVEHLYNAMRTDTKNSQIRTYVQCVAAVCRQSGHKFGDHLDKFVPLIQMWNGVDDDETRELCLQAFESFITKCPTEIAPRIGAITELCLSYMTHDPNYNYDEEGDDKDMAGYEDDEEEENDEYSDDDDMSWKVRRAAAKCLESIISTRHELLPEFYRVLSPVLISRFKEREENVKSDIFRAYVALLKQTKATMNQATMDPNSMEQEEMPIYLLQQQVPMIVRGVQTQMKEKSMKTRQDCFQLLKELCHVLPGALTNHIGDLMPGILFSLSDKNGSSNMKIEGLSFIFCLLTTHPPEVFHPHITTILPPVVNNVGDSFYKITAEALSVLKELVKVIRPLNKESNFDFTPFVKDIYLCTLSRLRTADIDQEVKEKAISTMGQVICNLGDHLSAELPFCLPVFLDRLRNEITRLTTVKALTKIAGSPLAIKLPILDEAIPILGLFLRKNQRALKLGTLQLLDCLIKNYNRFMYVELFKYIINEVPPLLDESDLHIAQYTLIILKSIAEYHPRALIDIPTNIFPYVIALVKSPLLQGSALNSMLDFFKTLVQCNLPGMTYTDLLNFLIQPVQISQGAGAGECPIHKQAYYSLAKCVAAITVTMTGTALQVVPQFISEIRSSMHDAQKIFTLLVVGEIGREIDLTNFENLDQIISEAFMSVSEEVKSAASYALGSIAIGNLQQYLPFILTEDHQEPRRQYLLLHSLKEVIVCLSTSAEGVAQLLPFVPAIWDTLYRHCQSPEEGTRNVVAECLGKLTLIDPHNLLPKLQESLGSASELMRTTTVTAIKFTISDQPSTIDPLLRQCLGEFLNTLEDEDLNVRRVALVAFNSAAHNKPSLIRDLLDSVLPRLYAETIIKRDLIREVEMGPFKHTVDDGLDLRKAAFECMYTLLDSCLDRLDIYQFITHVELGLKDHYDIKMLTYLMVSRLAQLCPGPVLHSLEELVDPLKTTCTMKVKANSVKQEYEKQDELKRSALRAVVSLLSIPDADKNQHLSDFVQIIKQSPDLVQIFDAIQKDSSNNLNDFYLMDQS